MQIRPENLIRVAGLLICGVAVNILLWMMIDVNLVYIFYLVLSTGITLTICLTGYVEDVKEITF